MIKEQGRTFVMGDIHGAYKALVQCLERSGFDYFNDTLIQLGDVADGHNEVFECVERLLNIKNLIAVKGNHDEWFMQFILTDYHPVSWNYGGKGTLISYLKHSQNRGVYFPSGSGYKTSLNASDIPDSHRRFFISQQLYYIDNKERCFLHAGFDKNLAFKSQPESNYYWNRGLWQEAVEKASNRKTDMDFKEINIFKEIYLGHTSTLNWGSDKPMTIFNITNMDTGAGYAGRLSIMDIDSKDYWQSDALETLYEIPKLRTAEQF